MAINLNALKKPETKPPMITIVSTPGVGKTTLGAMFPKPIFIQAEEGTSTFDSWPEEFKPTIFDPLPRSDRANKITTLDAITEQLTALATQEHDYKTVVIDTVTSLNALFEHQLCDSYGVDNIGEAAGGYGKGYLAVRELHSQVKQICDYLRNERGMAVVFLAHCGIKKIKNRPDAEEYTVYSLDMHDASIKTYVDLVDAVLYLRQEEFVTGGATDKKGITTKFGKVVQTGKRLMVTASDGKVGYTAAKNHYGMPTEFEVPHGSNPLLEMIPFFNTGEK